MERDKTESKHVTERLRSNISVLNTHTHLQNETISNALNSMHADLKQRVSVARLTRQSERRHENVVIQKSLREGNEARDTVAKLVNEGLDRPLEVALELRRQGFSSEWTRPKRIRELVRRATRKKRDREDTERQLQKAGKGVADRLGRAVKSHGEMMGEMLPDWCGDRPTEDVEQSSDELERMIMRRG